MHRLRDNMESLPTLAELELRFREVNAKTRDLEALIDAMQHSTDEDASMLLAKLRLGSPIEELVAPLQRSANEHSCR